MSYPPVLAGDIHRRTAILEARPGGLVRREQGGGTTRVKQSTKRIQDLLALLKDVDLNPEWQRGPVWADDRRSLLIDSVLRGMDIPKIYLLKRPSGAAYKYEAVDGQQRLRAFNDYAKNLFALRYERALEDIDGHKVDGKDYKSLHQQLSRRFLRFRVSVAIIDSATYDEVRQLFLRLQMGVSLNPPELRNAMAGPARDIIDSLARAHDFFRHSKISSKRYKWQDYLAHAFALAVHGGKTDLKAPNLRSFYEEFRGTRADELLEIMAHVGTALDLLEAINAKSDRRITQKWVFVDLFWVVYRARRAGMSINPSTVAIRYVRFEKRRRRYVSNPERLLSSSRSDPQSWDRALYRYIEAFRTGGANHKNIAIRYRALSRILRIREV